MDKMTISFNGKTEEEINSTGLFTFMEWQLIMPGINEKIRLRDDEIVSGIIVSAEGIKIRIDRKKGRKAFSKQ